MTAFQLDDVIQIALGLLIPISTFSIQVRGAEVTVQSEVKITLREPSLSHLPSWVGAHIPEDVSPLVEVIQGPRGEQDAVRVSGKDQVVTLNHHLPIPVRGSIQFWIQTGDGYPGGNEIDQQEDHEWLSLGPWCALGVHYSPEGATIYWKLADQTHPKNIYKFVLSKIPSHSWMHLALNYNSTTGQFDPFLNGTAVSHSERKKYPWPLPSDGLIRLHLSHRAIAGLKIQPEMLTETDLFRELGSELGSMESYINHVSAPTSAQQEE